MQFISIGIFILVSLVIVELLRLIVNYCINIYREHVFQIDNSTLYSLIKTLVIAVLFTWLIWIVNKYDLKIFNESNPLSDILNLVLGMLGVYVINISIIQIYKNNKDSNFYLGIPVNNMTPKIWFLDKVERSPFFILCLVYVVFAPFVEKLFNKKLEEELFWSIWNGSFLVVLVITVLNVIWGYRNILGKSELKTNAERNKHFIELNLVNLFEKFLIKDLFFGSSDFVSTASSLLENMSQNEKGKFLNIIYCSSISKFEAKITSSKFKRIYQRLILINPDRFENFENQFCHLLSRQKIEDYNYLFQILSVKYSFYNYLYKNSRYIFNKIIKDQFEKEVRYSFFDSSVIEALFPNAIVMKDVRDIEYWIHLNQIFCRDLPQLIENLVGTFDYTDEKLYKNVNKKYSLKSALKLKIQGIVNYQINNIHLGQDVNNYKSFIFYLSLSFGEYSLDYINSIMPKLRDNLSKEEFAIVSSVITDNLKIWNSSEQE